MKTSMYVRMSQVKAEVGRKTAAQMYRGVRMKVKRDAIAESLLAARIEKIAQRAESKGQAGVDVIHDERMALFGRKYRARRIA